MHISYDIISKKNYDSYDKYCELLSLETYYILNYHHNGQIDKPNICVYVYSIWYLDVSYIKK